MTDNKMTAEQALDVLADNMRDKDAGVIRLGIRDNDKTREAIAWLLENRAALSAPRVPEKQPDAESTKHPLDSYESKRQRISPNSEDEGLLEQAAFLAANDYSIPASVRRLIGDLWWHFVDREEFMLAASPEPVAPQPVCAVCDGKRRVETDNNGPIVVCPACRYDDPKAPAAAQHTRHVISKLRAENEALRAKAPLPITGYAVISEDEDVIEVDGGEWDALSMLAIAEEEEPNKAWSIVATIDAARLREGGE